MFNKSNTYKFSRRSMVFSASAASFLAPNICVASKTKVLDFSKQSDRFKAIVKMRACTDERVVYGGVKGLYYGVVDSEITPLYGVLAGTMAQYKVNYSTQQIIGTTFEVAYFTDWKTGRLLETFKNPYTDSIVEVPQTRMGPSKITFSVEGRSGISENPELKNFNISHRFIGPRNENGQVYLVTESIVKTPEDFPGPPFKYNEVTTYKAQMRSITDPSTVMANDSTHFNAVVSWRPWLKMQGHPGHLFGTASGGNYNKISDFPPYYVELTKFYHPDVFSDTEALLSTVKD